MKINYLYFYCLFLFIATVSCRKEEDGATFENVTEQVLLHSVVGDEGSISFTSTRAWTVTTDAVWLNLSPSSGEAGKGYVQLTVVSENNSNAVRSAEVELKSGDDIYKVLVCQEIGEYVVPDSMEYIVGVDGGEIRIHYESNIASEKLKMYTSSEVGSWLEEDRDSLETDEVILHATSNKGGMSRVAYLLFVKEEDGQQKELASVKISQMGGQVLESTDFSEDGRIDTLQWHEQGNGIPVVLMGDGFVDVEVSDGTYRRVMEKAMENLFSEEPVKSLRDFFDVFVINAVSENNDFGSGYQTAFSCKLAGGNSSVITGDDVSVQVYVGKVLDEAMKKKCLSVVLLNTPVYAGTTYYGYKDQNDEFVEFSISYCPVIDNLESERFRQVLVHEAIGHGFGKLEDEYAYENSGNISVLETQKIQAMQKNGWSQNIDFTGLRDSVQWFAFLEDSRYQTESLGVYEGACSYERGVYRPSEDSMMNSGMCSFNAPSRKSLYDKVMKLGNDSVTVGYEAFVSFDKVHAPVNLQSRESRLTGRKTFARPVNTGKNFLP